MATPETVQPARAAALGRRILNKVPEVTRSFWIIKVLCTTVGETTADFLNTTLNLGATERGRPCPRPRRLRTPR